MDGGVVEGEVEGTVVVRESDGRIVGSLEGD